MLAYRNVRSLWLLLLLHVARSALMFKRTSGPAEGDVRLFGSNSDSEGRVEVYHEGRWGTVCDDGWGMAEARVVCRQLQFPGVKHLTSGTQYGEAYGPIWLDDVKCYGTENHLSACGFKSWGVTDCSHTEDVGVICQSPNASVTAVDSTHTVDHSIHLSDELGQILDSRKGCDILILVQSATGNRQEEETSETTMCLHRMILSQIPFFNVSEETASIKVNVSLSCQPHFASIIRYIYTRKMDVTLSSMQCLHSMASKFGLNQLMEDTGQLFSIILPEDVSFRTQVSLYEYAEGTGDLVLQENCIQYLAWNFQYLTRSPAWTSLSTELFGALLSRSDLVVPDEYFLLQIVELWITENGTLTSLETQVDLLSRIRFPMIPAEKLYELKFSSSLYSTHKNMYNENILKALEFNVLLFGNFSHPKFNKEDDDYQPRIYTAEPWSTTINPSKKPATIPYRIRSQYGYGRYVYPTPSSTILTISFETPAHNSLIFKDIKTQWKANVFKMQYECANHGLKCESLPMAWLAQQNRLNQPSNIVFRNRLLLTCQGKYICQVKAFRSNLVPITVNETHVVAYPCPDDQYTYQFVVRPEYV